MSLSEQCTGKGENSNPDGNCWLAENLNKHVRLVCRDSNSLGDIEDR